MDAHNHPPFRRIREGELSLKHLEEYPVWMEFSSADSRENLLGPVLETDPFPVGIHFWIKARFQTPLGQSLSGYVIGPFCFALGIFQAGELFTFNLFLGEDNKEVLQALLPNSSDPIFPLEFETDFVDDEGHPIAGIFDFDATSFPLACEGP